MARAERKSLTAYGHVEPDNIATYRDRMIAARRGQHEFASDILNLVIECMSATAQEWDEFKRHLPGYEPAQALRRERLSKREPDRAGWLESLYRHMPSTSRRDMLESIARKYGLDAPLPEATPDEQPSATRRTRIETPVRGKVADAKRGR